MIFADKLIRLRKKAGWSQEELAAQMNVSRQSVSKWESAQSIPDLDKIIRLSQLFGVSTDYLLKDELEDMEETAQPIQATEETAIRKVTIEEANQFIKVKQETAHMIAYGVFLCIISPICLLLLGSLSESKQFAISENTAGMIGLIILLILVAIAVAIFIYSHSKSAPYEYLEKEVFETEYGVTGMVKEKKEQFHSTYTKNNIIGVTLCILAMIPFFSGAMFDQTNAVLLVLLLCLAFVIVGIAVILFIKVGVIWATYEKLLQEGDYTKAKKEKSPIITVITTVYWLTTTAIFLAVTLPTKEWKDGWIIWVIAAVLFPGVIVIAQCFGKRKNK